MTPVRISTTSYLIALAADVIGIPTPTADHPGADATWSPLAELGRTDDTALLPAVDRPQRPALADVPYQVEQHPILGELLVGPVARPLIHDTLALAYGGTR